MYKDFFSLRMLSIHNTDIFASNYTMTNPLFANSPFFLDRRTEKKKRHEFSDVKIITSG